MGIYIKGVEIPESCWRCTLYRTVDCAISRREESAGKFRNIRHPNCPLVYIPKPHGRLIDADSLMQYFNVYKYEEWTSEEVGGLINNAPTVIEGSE